MPYNETPTLIGPAMNAVKKTLVSAKNKVVRNRTKILGTIAVIATTTVVIQQKGIKQHNQFLEEKGLFDEFYTTDEN